MTTNCNLKKSKNYIYYKKNNNTQENFTLYSQESEWKDALVLDFAN